MNLVAIELSLALLSLLNHSPTCPPTHPSTQQKYQHSFLQQQQLDLEENLNSFNWMEDNLNFVVNGICPQFLLMGRLPQFFVNGGRPQFLENWGWPQLFCKWNMLQIIVNGRRPWFFSEIEDNLNFWKMEEDLNCFVIKEYNLYFFGKRKTTSFYSILIYCNQSQAIVRVWMLR